MALCSSFRGEAEKSLILLLGKALGFSLSLSFLLAALVEMTAHRGFSLALDDRQHVFFAHDEILLAFQLHGIARIAGEEHAVVHFYLELHA